MVLLIFCVVGYRAAFRIKPTISCRSFMSPNFGGRTCV